MKQLNGTSNGYSNQEMKVSALSSNRVNVHATPNPIDSYSKMARNDSKTSGSFNQMEIRK